MRRKNNSFNECDQCKIIGCRYKSPNRDLPRNRNGNPKCPKLPKSYEVWKYDIVDFEDRYTMVGRTPIYAQATEAVRRMEAAGEVGFIVERRADGSSWKL